MHQSQTEGVGELGLGQRQREGAMVGEADPLEAQCHLAQQMGDPLVGIAATEPDHPLAENRRLDQRVPPEEIGKPGKSANYITDVVMGDEADTRGRQAAEAVVHRPQMQALQIRDVARRVERKKLSSAVRYELEATDKAVQYQATFGGPI